MLTQSGLTLDLNVLIAGLYCLGAQLEDAAVRQQRHVQPPVLEQVAPHIRQLPGELLVERPGAHIARVPARAPKISCPELASAVAGVAFHSPLARLQSSWNAARPSAPKVTVYRDGSAGRVVPCASSIESMASNCQLVPARALGAGASVAQPVSADARATNTRRRMGVVMAPARFRANRLLPAIV